MLAYEEIISDETQQEESAFDSFGGFASPEDWATISAFIDNLSEYKIVEWLLRHTWDEWIEITTETFMNGYFNEDGSKTDYGTGLSKPSVLLGIKKAIQHGLIEQGVDDTDKTRIRKFYRVKIFVMDEVPAKDFYSDVNNLYSEEMPIEPDFMRGKASLPLSNNSNNTPINNTCNRSLRIQSQETLPEEVYSNKTHRAKENYPAFIRAVLKYLSVELGDGEHIAPNIAQATKIYKQSGMAEEEFTKLLYDLEEIARSKRGIKKVNSQGWPNRMPFFFRCLQNAARAATEPVAV